MTEQIMSGHAEPPPLGRLQALCEEAAVDANPEERDELHAAAAEIEAEKLPQEQAEKTFRRSADAIRHGISVFISHKFIHKSLAMQFAEMIRIYGQRRLVQDKNKQPYVFVAEQDLEGGKEWRKELEEAIAQAHWFILLLPDVEFEREWPIYEAGYFKRGMAQCERLICVHHKNVARVAQLDDFQSYESTPEGLKEMFIDLFFTPGVIPGMHQISFEFNRSRMSEDVKHLSESFLGPKPKAVTDFCMKFMEIEHRQDIMYETEDELLSARVIKIHDLADAFDRSDSFTGTFGELIASVNNDTHGRGWIEGLRRALNATVYGHPTRTVDVPFLGFGRGTAFRPCLHCVQRTGEGGPIEQFHVVFVEEFGQQITNAPAGLDALETALRWSYRSWWEIYEQYRGRLTPEDVDAIHRYTRRAEQEAQARGASDREELLNLFAADSDTQKALDNYQGTYYSQYRNPETKDGKIDRAFRDRDPKLMRESLDELRPTTLWFLRQASQRYAELLADLR